MRRVSVIFLMLSLMLLSGCRPHRQLERQMIEFTSTALTLPQHLLKIEDGTVEDCSWPDSSKVFVRYYGRYECTSCAITHLREAENDIVELCDSIGVVPMVIFASPDGDVSELLGSFAIASVDFPIYVDIDNVFDESSEIPEDLRFHRFLVGEDGHPEYVGNPRASNRLEELFLIACER